MSNNKITSRLKQWFSRPVERILSLLIPIPIERVAQQLREQPTLVMHSPQRLHRISPDIAVSYPMQSSGLPRDVIGYDLRDLPQQLVLFIVERPDLSTTEIPNV